MKVLGMFKAWRTHIAIITLICSTSLAVEFAGGTGEPNDPYQIATAEQLIDLGEDPNLYDKHFILVNDIDLDPNLPGRKVFDKAVIAPNTGVMEGWFQRTPFSGVFNGNGHTIANLACNSTDQMEMEVGLFGWVADPNAEIKNLGLIDPHVYAEGLFCAGSLVGFFCGTLRNCYAEGGTVTGRDGYVGGLAGDNRGRMVGCYSTGTVAGDSYVGGLVGGNYGRIVNCYSTSSVTGRLDVGGLVGYNNHTITNCYSTGAVDGDENVGGLVGRTMGTGRGHGSAEINCFWNVETSGQTQSAGGTGLTTTEMQMASTFLDAGWDFVDETINGPNDIWKMPPYQGYPLLAWQEVPARAELVAHWRFDETSGDVAEDSAGDNHAALHRTEWAEGKIGGAVQLNGFNAYVDCGDSVALGPEQMALAMWLEPRHMGGVRYIVSRAKKENIDDIDYTITRDLTGEIEFVAAQLDLGPVSVLSKAITPLREWSHLAVCLDGSEASIYINGRLDSSTNYSQRVPRQGYRLVISSHQGSTRFYNGKIDDVRIYNGPLSEDDILSLANPDM